ncbi:hypothetical protein RNJ44_00470 [Nakaseomyces bracarensis]|uniref:Uncharacterized protein n=1 Tax=Nakaseomyces bracarensis TaxID=273131 RepID=A0ABR4NSW7_9SACH
MFIYKIFQLYQLQGAFLYLALLLRWLVLMPLVGSRFLPGGIHEFLIYLLGVTSIFDILWGVYFRGFVGGVLNRNTLKSLNYLLVIANLHFYDDYEHAPLLRTSAYSSFIIALSLFESYQHWCKLFKRGPNHKRKTTYWKFISLFIVPVLFLSEFYLLLLNLNTPNFHMSDSLESFDKFILVIYFPVALTAYKKYLSRR